MFDIASNPRTKHGALRVQPPQAWADAFTPRLMLPTQSSLSLYLRGLLAVEVEPLGQPRLPVVPHESFSLFLQYPRQKGLGYSQATDGLHLHLSGLRESVTVLSPPGDCITLFALLTPLGAAVLLRGQALLGQPRLRLPLAHLLDLDITRALERRLADEPNPEQQLYLFAQWIEQAVIAQRGLPTGALRAARLAMRLLDDPLLQVEEAAFTERVARRQLERDLRRWFDVSPKQLAQIARVQGVARLAARGLTLSATAAELGYADQSHMTREIRRLTGVTPLSLIRSQSHAMARAFRQLTGNGVVYL